MLKKLRRKIRKTGKKLSRKNRTFERIYGFVIRKKREATYRKYSDLAIDEKAVLFDCFMGRRCGDSPKAIYDYMVDAAECKSFHFIWCLRGEAKKDFSYLKDMPRTRVVTWGTEEYYKCMATSKYWIANTRIPAHFKRRDEQVYVQCWHGTPFKKLFCDIETADQKRRETDKRVISEDALRYSYMISPSRFFSEVAKSAFNLAEIGKEGVLIETGYPRNDSITNRAGLRTQLRKELNLASDEKVILYAPTYREDQKKEVVGYNHIETIDFEKLLERIPEEYTILFRAHYYVIEEFNFEKYKGRIIDVSKHPDINDLYIVSDILITDYSSVFFDFSILKKPIVFYMPDLKHYRDALRGLYLGLDELPGPVAENQEELERLINELDRWWKKDEIQESYREFNDRFTYLEDGRASERVVKKVFGE